MRQTKPIKAVAVMACDEGLLPLESRIEQASDESELDEVYDTERHLLYVACTRARDQVLVTGVEPGSEFWRICCRFMPLARRLQCSLDRA